MKLIKVSPRKGGGFVYVRARSLASLKKRLGMIAAILNTSEVKK